MLSEASEEHNVKRASSVYPDQNQKLKMRLYGFIGTDWVMTDLRAMYRQKLTAENLLLHLKWRTLLHLSVEKQAVCSI